MFSSTRPRRLGIALALAPVQNWPHPPVGRAVLPTKGRLWGVQRRQASKQWEHTDHPNPSKAGARPAAAAAPTSRWLWGMSPCSARAPIISDSAPASSLASFLVSVKMMVRPHTPAGGREGGRRVSLML